MDTPESRYSSSSRKRARHTRKRKNRFHSEDERYSKGFCTFWQNYQKATQWGNSQEVAYWKSRAVALELENDKLRQHILKLSLEGQAPLPDGFNDVAPTYGFMKFNDNNFQPNSKRKHKPKQCIPKGPAANIEAESESQLKFEVSEEMKSFFETHMRHQIEQEKKQAEEEKKKAADAEAAGEENAKLICHPFNFAARAEELKLLYGDASPKIHGMETAIQLTFRRHCQETNASLWPNIPLRL